MNADVEPGATFNGLLTKRTGGPTLSGKGGGEDVDRVCRQVSSPRVTPTCYPEGAVSDWLRRSEEETTCRGRNQTSKHERLNVYPAKAFKLLEDEQVDS